MKTNSDPRIDALRTRYVRSATEAAWVGSDWSLQIQNAMRTEVELLHDVPRDGGVIASRLAGLHGKTLIVEARTSGGYAPPHCVPSLATRLLAAAGSASLLVIAGLSAEALGLGLHPRGWVLLLLTWIVLECHVLARVGATARRQFESLCSFGLARRIRRAERMRDEIDARNQERARVIEAELAWLTAQCSLAQQRAARARLAAASNAQ
jgi:hypothetical protein